jgi:hypothetical protein
MSSYRETKNLTAKANKAKKERETEGKHQVFHHFFAFAVSFSYPYF